MAEAIRPDVGGVRIIGLDELNASFLNMRRALSSRALKAVWKDMAEPVRRDAEERVETNIRNIGRNWYKMRVGVTSRVVYVAPVERGVKIKGNAARRRPFFAEIAGEQMEAALDAAVHELEGGWELYLDRVATINGF